MFLGEEDRENLSKNDEVDYSDIEQTFISNKLKDIDYLEDQNIKDKFNIIS